MTWPDDRRQYEQAIGVNELDGLIRDREPTRPEVWCYGFTTWGLTVGGRELNAARRHAPTLTVDGECPVCDPEPFHAPDGGRHHWLGATK